MTLRELEEASHAHKDFGKFVDSELARIRELGITTTTILAAKAQTTHTGFALVLAGGPDDTAPGRAEEPDGMTRKAPQFGQNLALFEVMQPAATKQFYESPENIEAADAAALCFFGDALRDGRHCFSNDADDGPCQRHVDASALFARFATLSTLSTAIAEEHGNVNRLIRTGSHSKLDELEAPTLDATGLRHMLRGVGLGVPNSMSVRPMLAEYGEVVGCRPRLTYAQFEALRAALNVWGDLAAAATIQCAWRTLHARRAALNAWGDLTAAATMTIQCAWRTWRARCAWHRAVVEAKTRAARKATIVRDAANRPGLAPSQTAPTMGPRPSHLSADSGCMCVGDDAMPGESLEEQPVSRNSRLAGFEEEPVSSYLLSTSPNAWERRAMMAIGTMCS